MGFGLFPFSFAENIMIIDAHATDTVPSHEVRQRANEALANAGEPMSEVTYDALRKRLAEAEEELSIWRSVFPDIAPERVLPDRRLLLDRIAELEASVVPLDTPDGHKLKVDADIPHLPTQLTYDCRNAISGHGPFAYTWEDKPHRLVYDLCREIERIAAIAALEGGKE